MKAYKYIVMLMLVLAGLAGGAQAAERHYAGDLVVWEAESSRESSDAVGMEEGNADAGMAEEAPDASLEEENADAGMVDEIADAGMEEEATDAGIAEGDSDDGMEEGAAVAEQPDAGEIPLPEKGRKGKRKKQSVAERTGAIHYSPAMQADCSGGGMDVQMDSADAARRVRFELGVRSLGMWLTDDRKGEPFHGSYIGSIYKLKAKQNWIPLHPYAQVEFALPGGLWLGAGATYSHAETKTLDNGGGDGDVESELLLGYAVLERPVWRLRPYAEVGGGWAFNSFDATSSWGAGNRREFVLEDSPAWMAGGGIGVAVTEHFTLDAHVRYVHYDVDGTYVFRGDSRPDTDFTFTTSHMAAGIGVSYVF